MGCYFICYVDANYNTTWENAYGEGEMNVRVCELMEELGYDSDEIIVFDSDSQL